MKDALDLFYLTICAVLQIKPNGDRIAEMDFEALRELGKKHYVLVMSAYALELVQEKLSEETWKKFRMIKDAAIRRNLLFESEAQKIYSFLEKEGIWYVPLKGALIKKLYPKYAMREMSDYDILYDSSHARRVYDFMVEKGYQISSRVSELELRAVLDFRREPIYHFEFHNRLFQEHIGRGRFQRYYENVQDRLIKEEGRARRQFTKEDEYVYMLAHAYKHQEEGGIGIKVLPDIYLFQKAYSLDAEKVSAELKKLKLLEFEGKLSELTAVIFKDPECIYEPDFLETHPLLSELLGSGAHGDLAGKVEKRVQQLSKQDSSAKQKKWRYLFWRIFPDYQMMKTYCPIVVKYPALLPVMYVYRIFRGLFSGRMKEFQTEVNYLDRLLYHSEEQEK